MLLQFTLSPQFVASEEIKPPIILFYLPSHTIAGSESDIHIGAIIDNVLLVNLKKQKGIKIIEAPGGAETRGLLAGIERVWNEFGERICVSSEYYVREGRLNLIITLWDAEALRIKRVFARAMPDDLAMLAKIEAASAEVASSIAGALPALEREALIAKMVNASLREKVDKEERALERIFSKKNELQVALFTGINMGRTAISYSALGCLISPSLNIEYSRMLGKNTHLRLGFEYLPFHIINPADSISEMSIELAAGFHSESLTTFSLDIGLALVYDNNSGSMALSYYPKTGETPVNPRAERLSLSIPIAVGFYINTTPDLFLNIRLKYHGLTFTIEPLDISSYEAGNQSLKYAYGFSPWTLLFMSIVLQGGFRF